jgi:peptidoglycan hydrolase CwlO-like protein
MDAYSRKSQHRAITLALSIISVIIVIIVISASISTSGIFEKQMGMLASTRTSEILEANVNNEVKPLKDEVQKIENHISNLPQEAAVGAEIEKLKDLMGKLSLREKKMEEIILQNPSKGGVISKASRTRSSRVPHRKA